MRKSKTIEVADQSITVMELTPGQVDQLMSIKDADLVAPSFAVLLGSDLNTDAVLLSTGLAKDKLLNDFTMEDLETIWRAAEEVNDFLSLRLGKALKNALAIVDMTKSAGSSV